MKKITVILIGIIFISGMISCASTSTPKVKHTKWIEGHYKVVQTDKGPTRVWVKGYWE